jgi:GNAT superfamily N-acetyltransferase
VPKAEGAEFEIRRYRPGDETGIIALFELTFGRTMGPTESAQHWQWEFRDRPGAGIAILLAESAGKLAAQYAVSPLRLQVDGRDYPAALSLDTATAPEFRGRGLFPKLATQLYTELEADQCVAVFGFPNRQSAPSFFHKLGWIELAPFPLLVKPLPGGIRTLLKSRGIIGGLVSPLGEAAYALFRRRPVRTPSTLSFEEVRQLPEDVDDLWERASAGKRVVAVRDRRHLDWRYLMRPETAYRVQLAREARRLVGIVVTLVQNRHRFRSGFIMDLLCEESRPDVARALVSRAETTVADDGAEVLSALMYPHGVAYRSLRGAGLRRLPDQLFPQELHFGVRALAPGKELAALREPSNWHITWGDSDVV